MAGCAVQLQHAFWICVWQQDEAIAFPAVEIADDKSLKEDALCFLFSR